MRVTLWLSAIFVALVWTSCQAPTESTPDAPTFTVTYAANGAETGAVPVDGKRYRSGETATILSNSGTLTKAGFLFADWNTRSNGTGTGLANPGTVKITGNLTLFAQWSPQQNTVSFNANGGSGAMTGLTVGTGGTATLPLNQFSFTGYTFSSWNTKADGTGTSYGNGSIYTMGVSSATLYARWVANQNTVSFNANGGSGTMTTLTANTGSSVTLPSSALTRAGYSFGGWSVAADGSGTAYADAGSFTMGPSPLVLYAVWIPNQSTLSFNANGGTGSKASLTLATGASTTLSGNSFTFTGHSFAGWNTQAAGAGTAYASGDTFTMGPSSVILYARWSANPQTISFRVNNGTGSMMDVSTSFGSSLNLPAATFTRTGYTFKGWNTFASGTGVSLADKALVTVSGNLTLFAQWTPLQNTVSFNANGGTGSMSDLTLATNDSAQLPNNQLTYAGQAFAGWNTKADGSGTGYANLATLSMGPSSVVLYAQWTAGTYNVTFAANGGSGTMAGISRIFGTTANLPWNTLTRTGYDFVGWNTESDGTGTEYPDASFLTMGPSAITLYAQWAARSFNLSYSANGGTGLMLGDAYPVDSEVTLSDITLEKSGYTFVDWSLTPDGSGTHYADGATLTMGAASVILYAQWTINTYQVTFNANGGSGTMDAQDFVYGTTAALRTNEFTNGSFVFLGWADTEDGHVIWADGEDLTMGASDKELFARWTNTVSISWSSYETLSFSPSSAVVTRGQTLTLSATAPGATDWRWYLDNTLVAAETDASFDFLSTTAGHHTLTAFTTINGTVYSGSITIKVNQ